MKLINFTIDLRKNDYQPVLAFEAGKNAFLVLAHFKIIPLGNPDRFTLENILLRLYNLNSDKKYVNIACTDYSPKKGLKPARVFLKFKMSKYPDMNIETVNTKNDVVNTSKGEKMEFHISFDTTSCKDDTVNGINNGNWPCNQNKIM